MPGTIRNNLAQAESISGDMAQVCSQNGGEIKQRQEVGGWGLSTQHHQGKGREARGAGKTTETAELLTPPSGLENPPHGLY